MRRDWASIQPAVFLSSAVLVVGVLLFNLLEPGLARGLFIGLQDRIVTRFGGLFVAATTLFLVFSVVVAVSPKGRLRLGPPDEAPAYGRLSWFSMLFAAGMGIGIMFYGVAEPILHYASPPIGEPSTPGAAQRAMTLSFFHWGLHAWAVYAVMGLAIAWFGHRKGLPLAVRSALHPLLGARVHGPLGHLVDVVAVFGTLFGLATSLGLGAMQINAGLHRLFDTPVRIEVQVVLIAVITACATTSVVLGLDRGIRRLSEINIALACLLLLFVLFAGPTAAILRALPARLLDYALALGPLSAGLGPAGDVAWQKSWTLFYWAWWIAWSPFVGTFIARISRGRTVREFLLGVLLVPSLVSCVWFTVFGWTALVLEAQTPGVVASVQSNVATGLYAVLERLPVAGASSLLAAVVVGIFFVTSSDSGSYVIDILTSGGHPDPPVWQRIFWAVSEGAVAAALLVGGGLKALQSAAINTGLPFCVILVLVCFALGHSIWREQARS